MDHSIHGGSVRLATGRPLSGIALSAFLVVSIFTFASTQPEAPSITIRENGYFRADLGFFFVENGRLDVYGGGLDSGVIWDNALGQYVLLRDAEKELSRKAAPYYHEGYQLRGADWGRIQREFTQKPARYIDFGPCDVRDQLDVPDDPVVGWGTAMRKVLPQGIKIKGVADFQGRFAVVISSQTPKERPSIYQAGIYTLHILLLLRDQHGWRVAANLEAERGAYYCGMRPLETILENGDSGAVVLLYSSVPQGSRIVSVERQIRSFLIRPAARNALSGLK